ncbi:MAG: DegQ family serine endoprotease [Pyrinomonadaceae bacterium]
MRIDTFTQKFRSTGSNSRVYPACLLLLVVFAALLSGCKNGQSNAQPLVNSSAPPPPGSTEARTSYAEVVDRVSPAVVIIRSQKRARAPQQFPFMNDPSLDQFGDRGENNAPRERRESGVGSGVIVSADGYLLTNHHVIDGAEQIKVDLTDGRTLDAKVVGSDPPSDLAVLKIDASNLPLLSLGDSNRVRIGDVVLAIGNPLGVGKTVTMGIISAKGRQTGLSNGTFEDFLQTDAPINQGNSGGALVNTDGELIGINSQILSQSGGSIGIGFAIPSNMARNVMDQLIKTGKVRRGQLGIIVQKVTTDMASSLGLQEARGVIVSQVQPGSAAERAGIKQGDLITALNGTPINDANSFRNQVASTQPGTEVNLTITRGGREQQLSATLGEFSAEKESSDKQDAGAGNTNNADTGKLGINVEPLTPEMASRLGVPGDTQGLIVTDVDGAGPAADAGLQRGDVIEQVNQQSVRSAEDLRASLSRNGTRPSLLLVNRRGTTVFVTVTPRR